MAKLIWGSLANKTYESGLDRGVLYPQGQPGVAWNGLISVVEDLEGKSNEFYHLDGKVYSEDKNVEDFNATVEAFTYPEGFVPSTHYVFGLSYRTYVAGEDKYKIHLVYNAIAEVPDITFTSIGETVQPINFVWNLTTTPVVVPRLRPFAHLVIDPFVLSPSQVTAIENLLYGTSSADPQLPEPQFLLNLLGAWSYGFGHGPFGHTPFGGNT